MKCLLKPLLLHAGQLPRPAVVPSPDALLPVLHPQPEGPQPPQRVQPQRVQPQPVRPFAARSPVVLPPGVRPPGAHSRPAPLHDRRRPAVPRPAAPPAVAPRAWKDRDWQVQRLAPTPFGRCARAASPVSRGDGIGVSGLETLGAAAITGVDIAGVAGTTHAAASVGATAITAGAGIEGGALSPARSPRKGICAAAAPVATSIL